MLPAGIMGGKQNLDRYWRLVLCTDLEETIGTVWKIISGAITGYGLLAHLLSFPLSDLRPMQTQCRPFSFSLCRF